LSWSSGHRHGTSPGSQNGRRHAIRDRVYLVLLYDESTVATDDFGALRVRHEFVGAAFGTLTSVDLLAFFLFDSLGFDFFRPLSG